MENLHQFDPRNLVLPHSTESALVAIDELFFPGQLNRGLAQLEKSHESCLSLLEFLRILTRHVWYYLSLTLGDNYTALFDKGAILLNEHLLTVFTYLNRAMYPYLLPLAQCRRQDYTPHCYVFVTLILANKYIHDFSLPSKQWLLLVAQILPLNLEMMKIMELRILDWMDWKLAVTATERRLYYSQIFWRFSPFPPRVSMSEPSYAFRLAIGPGGKAEQRYHQ